MYAVSARMMLDADAIDTDQSLGQQSRLIKIDVSHFSGRLTRIVMDGDDAEWLTRRPPPLWIADQVRNELAPRSYPAGTRRGVSLPPCGYCHASVWTDHRLCGLTSL